METHIFRPTEGLKLDKGDLQAFKKCAKIFLKSCKYRYLLANHLGISVMTLNKIMNNKPINEQTRNIVKSFIKDNPVAA
jgi:DNA invertase Pin-like site-specific DNA recombinase